MRHLYGRYVSLVPIFAYIERSEDGDKTKSSPSLSVALSPHLSAILSVPLFVTLSV